MRRLITVAEQRFLLETDPGECSILVRALDRFFRRVATTSHILPGFYFFLRYISVFSYSGVDYVPLVIAVVIRVSQHEIDLGRQHVIGATAKAVKQVPISSRVGG
jgi:hypothetical protein